MLSKMDVVPGQGVDFARLGQVLLSSPWFSTSAGVSADMFPAELPALLDRIVQRSVYGLRDQVSAKIDRLPLSYFDKQPRGELLSRVTNDVDNIRRDPAADPQPAAQLRADDHRGGDHDVLGQPAAGRHLDADRPVSAWCPR